MPGAGQPARWRPGTRAAGHMVTVAALAWLALPACGACDAYDPVDEPAPPLPLATLEGNRFDWSSLRGHPVAIRFWLPWCHTCARDVPEFMAAAREQGAHDVRVLAVSMDPDAATVKERAARFGLEVPLLLASGEVLAPMHVGAVPSTVFMDRDGVIRAAVNGPKSREFYRRRFQQIRR